VTHEDVLVVAERVDDALSVIGELLDAVRAGYIRGLAPAAVVI